MKIATVIFVSLIALASSAFASDVSVTSKYLCRVEDGKSPSLVKVGTLKAASFSVVLTQLSDKITAAKTNLDRAVKTKNKSKIAAAKAKFAAAKADKKKVQDCKAGKITDSGPTPTPTPNSNSKTVPLTFEEKFATYTSGGVDRCAFFSFFKWPAVSAEVVFNKITYDRNLNNPPAIPTENEVVPPYEDNYIYKGISGNEDTGVSFTVEAGFHWVQFGRFASFGNDCTNPDRKAEIQAYRAGSYANGLAHRVN